MTLDEAIKVLNKKRHRGLEWRNDYGRAASTAMNNVGRGDVYCEFDAIAVATALNDTAAARRFREMRDEIL